MSEREPTRRSVLGAAAAIAAELILPSSAEARNKAAPERIADASDLPPFGKLYEGVRQKIAAYQRLLRSPNSIRALTDTRQVDKTRALKIFEQHPEVRFDMLDESIKERVRDFFNRTTVWLGSKEGVPVIARMSSNGSSYSEMQYGATGGNAVFVRKNNRYFFATNAHVIEAIDPRSEVKSALSGPLGIDAAYYEISTSMIDDLGLNIEDAIDLDATVPGDSNPHGLLVAYGGFDPDNGRSAAHITSTGRKELLGVASHIGNIATSFIMPLQVESVMNIDRQSFTIPLPRGEARRKDPSDNTETRLADGTSGGGMVTISKNGEIEWIGNVYGGMQAASRGKKVSDVLLFHTRKQFRDAFEPKRIFDARPVFE